MPRVSCKIIQSQLEDMVWCKDVFCYNYEWPKQRACDFSKYSYDSAHVLVKEWCNKSNDSYLVWAGQDEDDFEFTVAHHAAYVEAAAFVDMMVIVPPGGAIFDAGMRIRNMWPTNRVFDAYEHGG